MEKIIYLVWGDGHRPEEPNFERQIVAGVRAAAGDDCVRGASVHVARQAIAARWLRRSSPPPETLWCMVSIWLDDILERERLDRGVAELNGARVDIYLLTESVPRWRPAAPAGEISAGLQLLSMLHRPDGMTHDEFVKHWTVSHLPLSLSIHPQWTYVRNIVTRPLNDGARPFDAVCEHGFEEPEHLIDPRLFYGAGSDDVKLAENMSIIRGDAIKFVDAARGDVQTTVEYVLKVAFSPRARPGREYSGPVTV